MWTLSEAIPNTDYLVGDEVVPSKLIREGHNPLLYFCIYEKPVRAKKAEVIEGDKELCHVTMDYFELTGYFDPLGAMERFCIKGHHQDLAEWSTVLFPNPPFWLKVDWEKSINELGKYYEVSKHGRVYRRRGVQGNHGRNLQ